jgi:hypothetical protein
MKNIMKFIIGGYGLIIGRDNQINGKIRQYGF